jgi:arabinan endo-1,5-alpha-L-arabinosidase
MKDKFLTFSIILTGLIFFSCAFGHVDGVYIKSVSKTEYNQFEDFDYSSVQIQIVSNGIPRNDVLTSGMVSGFDSSIVTDKQVITISNGSSSATFTIKIKANPVTSITCNVNDARVNYVTGESLDVSKITALCKFKSGFQKTYESSMLNFTGYSFALGSAAEQTVYVTFKKSDPNVKGSYKVYYHESYEVTEIECDPAKNYNINDAFEASVTVTAKAGGQTFTIPIELSQCIVTGFNSSAEALNQEVTVSYQGKSCVVIVNISNKLPQYILNKYTNPGFNERNMSTWAALNCHDPKLFQDTDGTYYVYSTDASIGNAHKSGVQIRSSTDLINWTCHNKSAIDGNWDSDMLKFVGFNTSNASTWAPTVIKQDNKYYMLHGIITDEIKKSNQQMGGPTACITLAIADSPLGPFKPAHIYDSKTYKQSNIVRYEWNYLSSAPFNSSLNTAGNWTSGFGAIDPEFVYDMETGELVKDQYGDYYIIYGSWKGGLALMTLDNETFKPTLNGQVLDTPADMTEGAFGFKIAGGQGAAYEGAQLIYNSKNGYYYLFVSMGDLKVDYRVGVGRSKVITGPYVDANGRNMSNVNFNEGSELYFHNVGNKILGAFEMTGEYGWKAPGGLSIFRNNEGKVILSAHSRTTFFPEYYFYLQNRQLFFTDTDWPVLNMNEYAGERLKKLKASNLIGEYKAVLTERGKNASVDTNATKSKNITLAADGTVSGAYSGKWTLLEDGYTIKFELNNLGVFTGYALWSVNWSLKNSSERYTYSFTTMCASSGNAKLGEHFFGNKL